MVNKIDRPNTTPTIRRICTFAVHFFFFLVEIFKLFTTRLKFLKRVECFELSSYASTRSDLEIRHLSVL